MIYFPLFNVSSGFFSMLRVFPCPHYERLSTYRNRSRQNAVKTRLITWHFFDRPRLRDGERGPDFCAGRHGGRIRQSSSPSHPQVSPLRRESGHSHPAVGGPEPLGEPDGLQRFRNVNSVAFLFSVLEIFFSLSVFMYR